MKIICFGDSITASGGEKQGWTLRLQAALNAQRPDMHQVINCGFGGRNSAEGLDRLGEFVLPHLPGILLLQWGINDCYVHTWQQINRVSLGEFRRNMRELVRIARERSSHPVLIVGHPLLDKGIFTQGNGIPQPENFAPYQTAIGEMAVELSTDLIDLPAELRSRGVDLDQFLSKDGVHLSEYGHHVYAEVVGVAIGHILARLT